MSARQPFPEPITPLAWEMAVETLCKDMDELGDFLGGDMGERKPCAYFGNPISLKELFGVIFNDTAPPEQVKAASLEVKARYLAIKHSSLIRMASDYMTN